MEVEQGGVQWVRVKRQFGGQMEQHWTWVCEDRQESVHYGNHHNYSTEEESLHHGKSWPYSYLSDGCQHSSGSGGRQSDTSILYETIGCIAHISQAQEYDGIPFSCPLLTPILPEAHHH